MSQLHHNLLSLIGKTPIVRVNRLAHPGMRMFVKMESFNPLSSVKDRLAFAIIDDAEKTGRLKPGMTVIDATSGNTGIGLAWVCAVKGYPFVATMAESFSVERRKMMRFLGAKVILTPAAERGTGMVKKAKELAEKHGWFYVDQFSNPANPRYHASTTGPEILSAFAGEQLDYFVTGWGTGGTLSGAGKIIKAARPEVKVIVAEPDNAALMSGGDFNPHPIQGWTPNFLPPVMDLTVHDEIVKVSGADAISTSMQLARQEGMFVGISSGATFAAALQIAKKAKPGSTILAMLPDTAERYFSTPLFKDIPEGSDPEP